MKLESSRSFSSPSPPPHWPRSSPLRSRQGSSFRNRAYLSYRSRSWSELRLACRYKPTTIFSIASLLLSHLQDRAIESSLPGHPPVNRRWLAKLDSSASVQLEYAQKLLDSLSVNIFGTLSSLDQFLPPSFFMMNAIGPCYRAASRPADDDATSTCASLTSSIPTDNMFDVHFIGSS